MKIILLITSIFFVSCGAQLNLEKDLDKVEETTLSGTVSILLNNVFVSRAYAQVQAQAQQVQAGQMQMNPGGGGGRTAVQMNPLIRFSQKSLKQNLFETSSETNLADLNDDFLTQFGLEKQDLEDNGLYVNISSDTAQMKQLGFIVILGVDSMGLVKSFIVDSLDSLKKFKVIDPNREDIAYYTLTSAFEDSLGKLQIRETFRDNHSDVKSQIEVSPLTTAGII